MSFLSNRPNDDWESKYEKYCNMLFKLCFVILANRHDAEDALQNTFLRYINKKPVFNETEHEKAWFIKVATNVCRDMRRFSKKYCTINLDELSDYYVDEEQGYILEQILTLPLQYKTVIHLYYVEGYSVDEISRLVGASRSAIKMRLMRGRNLLKIEILKGE